MILEKIKKVYFLGIGGIGMSALARYFLSRNCQVSGYDRSPSPITTALQREGALISFKDNPHLLDSSLFNNPDSLLIYTPAIPSSNLIYNYLIDGGNKLYKRSEILGELSKNYKTIGIAGTHGKTTVSSMNAHILNNSKLGCHAFLGGITKNYNSNLITHPSSNWMVVEADEYDRSFLQLFPQIGLVTSMDADHLDIYGDHAGLQEAFRKYASQIKKDGFLIVKHNLINQFEDFVAIQTYDLENSNADFYAHNIILKDHNYQFTFHYPNGKIENIKLRMPGLINLENAVAACSAAKLAGVDDESIKASIQSFKGIKRRMELVLQTNKISFYDDYAHHPEEIKAAISSIKALYPNTKLTVVFQPHLFSRTQDFAIGFANSLDMADQIILLDIYPAREEPIAGISSESILSLMQSENKQILGKQETIAFLKTKNPSLLLTLGAGDIDRIVEPIKTALL